MDAFLSNLRRVQRLSTESRRGKAAKRQVHDWLLQAASIVAVVSEIVFGASSAWQPGAAHPADSNQSTADTEKQQEELEALVILIEEEWVKESLWGVPTSNEYSWQGNDSQAQHLTPQARLCSCCLLYTYPLR